VRSILVPTPGQAEQEYLAAYLHQQQFAFTIEQNKFSLSAALQEATNFYFRKINWNMEGYKKVINEFINSVTR
jgi:UDP-N-acetylglucosamine:LPS N-acetylglucosamine transferase